ncbi:MAG: XRE family transcriptional regulator [Myxococcales bacterium]|nr:XRE family transcriptional regulator [Myxococcales bacterium]
MAMKEPSALTTRRAERGKHLARRLEMPLAALRTASARTQAEVADASGIDQGDVSRLEARTSFDDAMVSTLRRYVEALGGSLELVAVFPKGHRVTLTPSDER